MSEVIAAIFPVFIVVALGYVIRRARHLDAKTLSTLNIYLFIPSLIFTGLSERAMDWGLFGRIAAVSVLMVLGMAFILGVIAQWRRVDAKERGAFMMTMFPNLGNFGIPVCKFAFGDEGLAIALLVVVCGSFLQNSLGIYFAQRTHHGVGKATLQVFQYPLIYSFLLALVCQRTGFELPIVLSRALSITADAAIPVQLMILGIQLAETRLERSTNVLIASVVRLVGGPALALALVLLVGLHDVAAKAFIVQMSGPVAVAMAAYGVQFNVAPRFLSSMVAWTFLFSLGTVSLVLFALRCFPI